MKSAAAAPIPSSWAIYGSGSSRGYSMLAITSAALASAVPGALEAAVSASTRSLRIPLRVHLRRSVPHERIEHRQRQGMKTFNDQFGAGKLDCGVACRHSHTA